MQKICGGRKTRPFCIVSLFLRVVLFHLVQNGAWPHPHSSQREEDDTPRNHIQSAHTQNLVTWSYLFAKRSENVGCFCCCCFQIAMHPAEKISGSITMKEKMRTDIGKQQQSCYICHKGHYNRDNGTLHTYRVIYILQSISIYKVRQLSL